MTTWEEANAAFQRLFGGQMRKPLGYHDGLPKGVEMVVTSSNGTHPGTSISANSDYQQIIGTEPEGDTNWGFSLPEDDE